MEKKQTNALAELLCSDAPEAFIKTIDEWFISYVAHELSSCDQETHERHATHYLCLKRLLIDH